VQAQCPQCSTRFQLDDSKVPDRAFKVRCPRCEHVVVLQGRSAETPGASPSSPTTSSPDVAKAPAPPAAPSSADPLSPPPVPVRREHTGSKDARDALVALPDPAQASAITTSLSSLDYNVDVVEDVGEGARLLAQGVYELAVTAPADGQGRHNESLAQRIKRLPPGTRRRVFVVLVSEEYTTADGTQAWAAQADLVLHPHDAGRCENVLRATLEEKQRLYKPYEEARQKIESD
jgi:predicted Zn finger-like uncharacterized protein